MLPTRSENGGAAEFDPTQGLYQAIVQRAEAASVLTATGEAILAGQGLLAVPVQADDGAVIGMIKVEAMDAYLLGSSSLGALEAVATVLASPMQGGMGRNGAAFAGIERIASVAGAAAISEVAVVGQGTGNGIWRHVAKRLPAGLMGR